METDRLQPLTVGAATAAKLLGIGTSTWHLWRATGRTPAPIRIGGRVLWKYDELRAWIEAGAPCREKWEATRGRD